jgi:hypothetical protein
MLWLFYLTEEWGGGGREQIPLTGKKKPRFNRVKFTHIEGDKNSDKASEGPMALQ